MATTTTLTTLLNHILKPLSSLITNYTSTCLVPSSGSAPPPSPSPSPSTPQHEFVIGQYHFELTDLVSPLHHITCFFHVLKASNDPRLWVFSGIFVLLLVSLLTTLLQWVWRTFVRAVKMVGVIAVFAVAVWVLVEVGVVDGLVQFLDWVFLEKDGV